MSGENKFYLKQGADYNFQMLGSRQIDESTFEVAPIEINEQGYLIVDTTQSAIVGVDLTGTLHPIKTDYRGYQVPIDYLHDIVHQKAMYTISHTFLAVGINGFARLRLKTGTTHTLHFDITFNADLKCRLKTYSAPTITGNGTLFQPFNRIIGYGNGLQTFQVYLNPTFTGGTLRANDFIGSNAGTGGQAIRAGGGRSGGIESVLLPNQEYIIEFQNVGTEVSDIGIVINCYEKPDDFPE
jgi:hypothetical protein